MKTAIGLVGGLAAIAMLLFSYAPNSADGDTQLFLSKMLDADEQAYLGWINEHSKSYTTKEEYKFRLEQFKKIRKAIAEHDEEETGIQVGLNQYSDNTEEEWAMMRGLHKLPDDHGDQQEMSNEELEELKLGRRPDNRDWRDEGWVTPVKNQGRCGSCWAFGAIAALEGSYAKRRGTLRAFSEQQIVDCVTVRDGNPCCGGCKGGHIDQVFAWLKNNNQGAVPMEQYPYKGIDTQQCTRYPNTGDMAMVKNYEPVMSGFAYPLFLRVNHFVVAAAVEAGGMTWRIYKGGIVKRGCGNVPDHAVAIVGYGKEPNGQEHFIVKNSWGTTWGENGYIRIAPDQCGITLGALNVDVPKK